jgi:Protein chain release factor A
MFDSLQGLREEHAELQKQLSDSAIHANPGLSKKLNRRYAELNSILAAEDHLRELEADMKPPNSKP